MIGPLKWPCHGVVAYQTAFQNSAAAGGPLPRLPWIGGRVRLTSRRAVAPPVARPCFRPTTDLRRGCIPDRFACHASTQNGYTSLSPFFTVRIPPCEQQPCASFSLHPSVPSFSASPALRPRKRLRRPAQIQSRFATSAAANIHRSA